MSVVLTITIIRILGSIVEFGLKFFGAKFLNEVLDRISLFYFNIQERHLKQVIADEMKQLDLEARAQAIRARDFAEK